MVASISPTVLPTFPACFLVLVLAFATAWAVGLCLLPPRQDRWSSLDSLAPALSSGLMFMVGVWSTIRLGRPSFLTAVPLLLLAFAAWSWWRKEQATSGNDRAERIKWTHAGALLLLLAVSLTASWYLNGLFTAGDQMRGPNMDLGYYAMLIDGLPKAGVASGWAATLGDAAIASGETADQWYHWSAIWLGDLLHTLSGLSPLQIELFVKDALLDAVMVVLSASIVRHLTGWKFGASLAAGAVAIMALPVPNLLLGYANIALGISTEDGFGHFHLPLAGLAGYKFEVLGAMTALGCWLRGQRAHALVFVLCAAISAPHNVAGIGSALGTLGVLALVRRDRRQIVLAAGVVGTLLLGWAVVHFAFKLGIPKKEAAALVVSEPSAFVRGCTNAMIDIVIGLAMLLPLLPGMLHLIRARDVDATDEMRALGWMAIAALIGGYTGYRLFLPQGDRSHFVWYSFAVFAIPIGVWGTLRMRKYAHAPRLKRIAFISILVATASGALDLALVSGRGRPEPCTATDLAKVKQLLDGQPFGYVSRRDRPWWIPQHAVLSGVLESRCIRLNPTCQVYGHDKLTTGFYEMERPFHLLPPMNNELEQQWAVRLADRLGIKHILAIGDEPFPDELRSVTRPALEVPGVKVYELLPAADRHWPTTAQVSGVK